MRVRVTHPCVWCMWKNSVIRIYLRAILLNQLFDSDSEREREEEIERQTYRQADRQRLEREREGRGTQ